MNKFSVVFAAVVTCLVLSFSACNETTSIGSDLLDQDLISTTFTDTITLEAITELGDSVATYVPFNPISPHPGGFLFGNFIDPVFGRTTASIYSNLLPSSIIDETPSTFITNQNQIDSVILMLPYFYDGLYGDLRNGMDINVYQLEEFLPDSLIFNYRTFDYNTTPIGSSTIRPNLSQTQTLTLLEPFPSGDSIGTIVTPNHMRIPLSNLYGFDLMTLSPDSYTNDTAFLEEIKGIYIESTSNDAGMLAFQMLYNRTGSSYVQPGIKVYYHVDTIDYSYTFALHDETSRAMANPSYTHLVHDYAGSIVEPYIDDAAANEEFVFVQGGNGLETVFTIPYTDVLDDVSIIKAELEVYAYTFYDDSEFFYPPVSNLVLSREEISEDGDTTLVIIDDAFYGFQKQNLSGIFGGIPLRGSETIEAPYSLENNVSSDKNSFGFNSTKYLGEPIRYTMNIAAHLNKLRDDVFTNKLYLTVFTRPQRPGRVVLCGPGHPEYPAKINLYYSK